MQPVRGDPPAGRVHPARFGGHVHVARAGPAGLLAVHLVEAIDLGGDPPAVPPFGVGRRAPVGDRQDDHPPGVPAREGDRPVQEGHELSPVLLDVAPAELVVHAYEQGDERERPRRARLLEARQQLVRRPARARHDDRIGERQAALPEVGGDLRGPALARPDTFAYGVGIAQRQPARLARRAPARAGPVRAGPVRRA
jgi:hypothetical protein